MDNSPLASNPFALMMHPESVVQAMERSDRLARLHRRICKPLDKPNAQQAADEASPILDAGFDVGDDFRQD